MNFKFKKLENTRNCQVDKEKNLKILENDM